MIGWTLGKYFFKRYCIITGWFFLGIFAMAFLIDFTEFSSRTSDLPQYSMLGALYICALHIPMIMQQVVPFIALFAGMTTLISLNRKYELVIARASGISAWQFLFPFCFGAFLFGVLTIAIINPFASWGFEKSSSIEADWRSQKSNEVMSKQTPWFRQRVGEDETIIGAKIILDQGRTLRDASFYHFDKNDEIILRRDAELARLENGYWELRNVTETEKSAAPVHLDKVRVRTNLNPQIISHQLGDPEGIPFYELWQQIELSKVYGYPAYPLAMQLHSLIALPMLLVAMTLIAATVSLNFVRFGQSGFVILGGVLSGFLLYVMSILVKSFGSAGFIPPVIAAWVPVVVASFIGISFLLNREDG